MICLLGGRRAASSSCVRLLARQLAQLGVGLGVGHLLGLREVGEQLLVALPRGDERIELGVLARELQELGALVDHLGGAEQRADLFVATLERRHLVPEVLRVEHGGPQRGRGRAERLTPVFAYFLLKRSMRPAVSISFCLPVKNGWQFEQMSTPKSPRVENVSWTVPHAQVMRAGR